MVYWSAPIAAFDHYRISYRAAEGNRPEHSCSCPEFRAANPLSLHLLAQASHQVILTQAASQCLGQSDQNLGLAAGQRMGCLG